MPRKYQDVYDLLNANPNMSPAEAGRQLGYQQELHWKSKKNNRVGPKHRPSDSARYRAEEQQRIGPKNIPASQPGFDRHHKRMISLLRPLYEGLSEADSLKLSQHAVDVGMPLGDVEDNYAMLPKPVHDKVHRFMEQNGMRPSQMPDFSKADLANRIKAFDVLYKDFLQPEIDKQTNTFLDQYSKGRELIDYHFAKFQDFMHDRNAAFADRFNGNADQRFQFAENEDQLKKGRELILQAFNVRDVLRNPSSLLDQLPTFNQPTSLPK